jgi:hypothetical protein
MHLANGSSRLHSPYSVRRIRNKLLAPLEQIIEIVMKIVMQARRRTIPIPISSTLVLEEEQLAPIDRL